MPSKIIHLTHEYFTHLRLNKPLAACKSDLVASNKAGSCFRLYALLQQSLAYHVAILLIVLPLLLPPPLLAAAAAAGPPKCLGGFLYCAKSDYLSCGLSSLLFGLVLQCVSNEAHLATCFRAYPSSRRPPSEASRQRRCVACQAQYP
jgi:hypothetical protein